MKEESYTFTPPMGCTACTEPQCLYKGALTFNHSSLLNNYISTSSSFITIWPLQIIIIIIIIIIIPVQLQLHMIYQTNIKFTLHGSVHSLQLVLTSASFVASISREERPILPPYSASQTPPLPQVCSRYKPSCTGDCYEPRRSPLVTKTFIIILNHFCRNNEAQRNAIHNEHNTAYEWLC